MKNIDAFLCRLLASARASLPRVNGSRLRLIYGGTFNPIHCAHVEVVRHLSSYFPGAIIHIMPCFQLATKSLMPTSQIRLQMIRAAFDDTLASNNPAMHATSPGIYLDETELMIPQPSVTWQTAKKLMDRFPSDKIAWVVGSDVLATIHLWPDWKALFNYCHLYVIARQGCLMQPHHSVLTYIDDTMRVIMAGASDGSSNYELDPSFTTVQALRGGVFYDSHFTPSQVSSTMVRQMISCGVDCPYLHPDVLNIILQNQLYAPDN